MRHSDELWTEENGSVGVSEKIVENLSSGRKIFRFLKFLEAIRKIKEYYQLKKRKPKLIKVLTFIGHACAFFLYLSDNIVWLSNMGITKKFLFQNLKWKRFKDFFALWKNVVEIIKYLFDLMRNYKI
jgi:hypothetical protein